MGCPNRSNPHKSISTYKILHKPFQISFPTTINTHKVALAVCFYKLQMSKINFVIQFCTDCTFFRPSKSEIRNKGFSFQVL
jgi:hypothetical protein